MLNDNYFNARNGFIYWCKVRRVLINHEFRDEHLAEFKMTKDYYLHSIEDLIRVLNEMMTMALLEGTDEHVDIIFNSDYDDNKHAVDMLVSLFPLSWIERMQDAWQDEDKIAECLQDLFDECSDKIGEAFTHVEEWTKGVGKKKENVKEVENIADIEGDDEWESMIRMLQ